MPRPGVQTDRPFPLAALLLVGMLVTTGCSQRPTAAWPLASEQSVLDSAQHWRVVADDVGSAISAHLVQTTGKKEPVFVHMARGADSLFGGAFLDAVMTRLVEEGHAVAVAPRPEVVAIGVDMLVVPFGPRERNWTAPGPLTLLGSGASVANLLVDSFPWGVTAVAAGVGLDAVLARPQETDTEMVLTVSLARDGFYTFRTSAVYYVPGRDLRHYLGEAELMALRTFNEVPPAAIGYDLGGQPYVIDR